MNGPLLTLTHGACREKDRLIDAQCELVGKLCIELERLRAGSEESGGEGERLHRWGAGFVERLWLQL